MRDYDEYVDGKPRLDGVRDFLASRAIELPEGSPGDPPDAQTINGLANAKNLRHDETSFTLHVGDSQAFPWQAPKPGPAPEQPAHRAPSRRRPRGSG